MKKILFILCLVFVAFTTQSGYDKINNLKTFAKAYGYIKYFHPSDEAASIDWNKFAAYGAQKIIACKSQLEVINTLNNLFNPIAPSVVFSAEKKDYNLKKITPNSISGFQSTFWQHSGVSVGMNYKNGPYKSIRANRDIEVEQSKLFGNLSSFIDVKKYKGKSIKLTGWVKLKKGSEGTGHLWIRVDKSDKTIGFFENMYANPIKSNEWKQYEIIGEIDSLGANMIFGCMIAGKGTLYVDDIHLYYKENENWLEIPIKNNNFEANTIGQVNEKSQWFGKSKGYLYEISRIEKKEGKQAVSITYNNSPEKVNTELLFEAKPKFGELIEEEIGENIFCQIPLNLYCKKQNTYPKGNISESFLEDIENIEGNPTNLYVRLGNIINTYNVFQHFYPYFNEVNVDWEKELEKALSQSFSDTSEVDHRITLQKFTAPLKDGHIHVSYKNNTKRFVPPIKWEWIEGKLVVIKVENNSLNIKVGDTVSEVNGQLPENYFKEFYSRVSGSKGWKDYRVRELSLFGEKDSELTIKVDNKEITLQRNKEFISGSTEILIQENSYKFLDNNIIYLNIGKVQMDTIYKLMPKLKNAKGIICDLRTYPTRNRQFISHLLKENDTSKAWMKIPKIIYPDQKNIIGHDTHGWQLKTQEPYLGDKKIIFLIDGRAISYAESYMSFIKRYKLATIIGQPTAGANGNINPFNLLGGYSISWTGMKVVKHDGTQHHTIGVLPDIYVNKTIRGVKLGKDEYLDKAIELILK